MDKKAVIGTFSVGSLLAACGAVVVGISTMTPARFLFGPAATRAAAAASRPTAAATVSVLCVPVPKVTAQLQPQHSALLQVQLTAEQV